MILFFLIKNPDATLLDLFVLILVPILILHPTLILVPILILASYSYRNVLFLC